MYRQIRMNREDCDLQRILYRSSPNDPIAEYRLLTVTYGTKSAPYLATKCLSEIGNSCDTEEIARIIKHDFYVDDLLSGADTENQCHEIYKQLTQRFDKVHMPLRKWCSNSQWLMSQLPTSSDVNYILSLSEEDTVSTLGLHWQPSSDTFTFKLQPWTPSTFTTKRTLLSDMHKLYDPLGLLTPAFIKGKVFLQQLWALKLGWDTVVSSDIHSRWTKFYLGLKDVEKLSVPRTMLCNKQSGHIYLHGFCDASQLAYGACIYLSSRTDESSSYTSRLYTSRSRVAPLKHITIPRLELCAAVLLTELLSEVLAELNHLKLCIKESEIVLWTDSTIVLSWIKTELTLQSFVANRVMQICEVSKPTQWRHVPTHDNPADLISRGITATDLVECTLWWHGPKWLQHNQTNWPSTPIIDSEVPESKPVKLVLTTHVHTSWILDKYSKWLKLIRVTAWLLRFKHNSTQKRNNTAPKKGHLSVEELNSAEFLWIKQAQSADQLISCL